ncbi:hypothetical protein NOH62_23355, partial [Escherichia coli]|uniref:hypothetical protein n=1 Tax=Escherichia coli TaxID=562 RepID=UPI0035CCCF10|nr:hypothetical protein [Escherichia coli]
RLRFSGPKTSIICSPMTSLKTSIKTITYLSDTGCLEIQGASLVTLKPALIIMRNYLFRLKEMQTTSGKKVIQDR